MLHNMILPGAVETAGLPREYQAVEYIQSTATTSPDTGQRISTGIYPTQNTKVIADAEFLSGENFAMLCGAYTSGTNQFAIFHSGSWQAWFGNSAQKTISGSYTGRKTFTLGGGVFSVDSSSVAISSASFKSTFQLALFAMAQTNDTTFYYHASIKLYSMQIYEGSTLVRDFVPCYRKSDGSAGLYDLVEDVFYPNIGTGNFKVGEDVDDIAFTYSGSYTDNRENGIGTVTLNTSGVFEALKPIKFTAYILGAGGAGNTNTTSDSSSQYRASGGGGGQQTVDVELAVGTYEVIIGTGGTTNNNTNSAGSTGGSTAAFGYVSTGGEGGSWYYGAAGKGGTPNGNDGQYIYGGSKTFSGGSPNGGGVANGTGQPGGDGYVELTFI